MVEYSKDLSPDIKQRLHWDTLMKRSWYATHADISKITEGCIVSLEEYFPDMVISKDCMPVYTKVKFPQGPAKIKLNGLSLSQALETLNYKVSEGIEAKSTFATNRVYFNYRGEEEGAQLVSGLAHLNSKKIKNMPFLKKLDMAPDKRYVDLSVYPQTQPRKVQLMIAFNKMVEEIRSVGVEPLELKQ